MSVFILGERLNISCTQTLPLLDQSTHGLKVRTPVNFGATVFGTASFVSSSPTPAALKPCLQVFFFVGLFVCFRRHKGLSLQTVPLGRDKHSCRVVD